MLATTPRQWLDDLIRQHDDRVARRGRDYVPRVGPPRYDAGTGAVTCPVAGSADEPYTVTLRPPGTRTSLLDPPFSLLDSHSSPDATCTCPYGEQGRFLCKHTFAAATRLAELWDARPDADLADLLTAFPPAARPLQLLDAFLNDGDTNDAASEPTMRLCWLVKPHQGGPFGRGLGVRAVTETWLAGRWRRSDPLPWDRLVELLDSADLVATPQDHQAVRTLRRDERTYGFHSRKKPLWTIDPFALLTALAGHPQVFLVEHEDRPITVSAGILSLAVVVHDDGLAVVPLVSDPSDQGGPTLRVGRSDDFASSDLSFPNSVPRSSNSVPRSAWDGTSRRSASRHDDHSLKPDTECRATLRDTILFSGSSGVIALDRTHARLVVAEADPKTRQLVAALCPDDTVPFLDVDQLVARLVRVESLLPVFWPEELRGDRSAADGRILVRLDRLDLSGLSIDLAVRPDEGAEPFPPGVGPAVVPVCDRGRRSLRVRDLEAERRDAEAVIDQLGLRSAPRPKPWRWVIHDPQQALRVTEQLAEIDQNRAVLKAALAGGVSPPQFDAIACAGELPRAYLHDGPTETLYESDKIKRVGGGA